MEETKEKTALTPAQENVIKILQNYPNDIIMFNGWLTGGHGVCLDMRSVNALRRKGIIINDKLSESWKKQ